LVAVALGAALLAGSPAAQEDRGVSGLVPPAPPGWALVEGPVDYGPDTLYEYIDGAARMYHAFGFARLAHARYAARGREGSPVTLDIYDMGDALGAYGIYTNTRPVEAEPRPWGAEGYGQGRVAAAWRGAIYVHAKAESADRDTTAVLERLVAAVAGAAPGEPSLPAMAGLLPRQGFVRNSDRYVANDLLGQAFLPGGCLAEYAVNGGEYLLFLSDTGSALAAEAALDALRAYAREDGQVLGEESRLGQGGFRAVDPGLGPGIVARQGRFVAGIWGGPADDAARAILLRLLARLGDEAGPGPSPAPRDPED